MRPTENWRPAAACRTSSLVNTQKRNGCDLRNLARAGNVKPSFDRRYLVDKDLEILRFEGGHELFSIGIELIVQEIYDR